MCSASASRRPSAPKCRSTIHSFSARNRRPDWMPVSIRFCTPACPSLVFEVFGRQRKRLPHDVHPPAVQHAEIERREQPLVRIDDERIGVLGAAKNPFVSRNHRGDAGVRRVDVQPDAARDDRRRRSSAADRCSCSTSSRPWRSTASGSRPARRSSAMACDERVGPHAELARLQESRRSASWPRPSRITALSTDECACSEQ